MCLIVRLLNDFAIILLILWEQKNLLCFSFSSLLAKRYIISVNMSETAYIDELLKAEQEATEIIENAQKERYYQFTSPSGVFLFLA